MNSTSTNGRTGVSANPEAAIAAYNLLHSDHVYTKLYWGVANTIGIPQALLIEIIEKWCQSNERCNKRGYFHDGAWWTSATYKEWAEKYPALGKMRTIQALLLSLEKSGYVISSQPKASKGDNSKFYRVNRFAVGSLVLPGNETPIDGIAQKTDDANNTIFSVVQILRDVDANGLEPSIVQKKDDVNDTSRPIVQNPNTTAQNPNMPRPKSQSQQAVQGLNKIKGNILTQSITAIAGQSEENAFHEEEEEATLDIHPAVNNFQDCATNDKTPHEDPLCGAAKRDLQKRLTFDSDLTKEFDFLSYYRSHQKAHGKDIRNVASYLTTTLSKGDEGSSEVHCLFKEWQAVSRSLGRKIGDFAENPDQIKRQREKYDFTGWDGARHQAYLERLMSEGLTKFRAHDISNRWYEWASAKHPDRFVDIPA